MTFKSKQSLTSATTGLAILASYAIHTLRIQPHSEMDLRAWAATMLVFIGIGIAAQILVQILFHIFASIGIAVKEQKRDAKEVERIIASTIMEDEMDKLIALKANRIGYAIVGIGFTTMLIGLALGASTVVSLHVLFASAALGSVADGIASVFFYEGGVRNG